MARAPSRPAQPATGFAEVMARLDAMTERMDEVASDAREARDATIKLAERSETQNIPKALTDLWVELKRVENASRVDLVNAIDRINTTAAEDRARIKALEDWRAKIEGAHGALGWLSRHAPWLLSAGLAGLALFGKKIGP